jgi:NTP pyrophosphatase (non-canonical NTP hydrolase)
MTFADFQRINKERCTAVFHPVPSDRWPFQNWALCVAGEAGELCNIVKKVLRGDFPLESAREDILREVADIITYCDLLCTELGAETGQVVMDKFEEVSKRHGYEARD